MSGVSPMGDQAKASAPALQVGVQSIKRNLKMKQNMMRSALKWVSATVLIYSGLSGAAMAEPVFTASIPIGRELFGSGVNDWDNEIYEASSAESKLYVIDALTNSVKDTIDVGFGAQGVAYYRKADQILLVDMGNEALKILDRKTRQIVGSIAIPGHHAVKVAVDQALGKAWVTSMHGGSVSVVDLKKRAVLDTITIGTGGAQPPHCNPWAGECVAEGSVPIEVGVDQKRHRVYVASYKENHVTAINGKSHKVIGSRIPVGSVPNGMGINPKTNSVYVANWQDGTVSVIKGTKRKVIATIPVGSGAQAPTHCYEALVITGCSRWGSMPMGDIGVDQKRDRMYVTNSNDGTISVINGKSNTILGGPVQVTSGKLLPDGCFDFGACTSGSAARSALFSAKTNKLFIDAVHDKTLSVVELK